MNKMMSISESRSGFRPWLLAVLLSALAAGCGGGGGGDAILGNGGGGSLGGGGVNVAPTVTATINANGATNVAVNTKVGWTFSEAMDASTVTSANFTLKQTVSGAAVTGATSYTGVSGLFVPASDLAPNTNYTATVKGGASGVKDLTGVPMASDFVWSWTTGAAPDTTAPTVTGSINADGATNVAVNTKVGATFSEGMDPLTVTSANFGLKQTVSGAAVAGTAIYSGVSVVFTPASNLAPSTNYTVTVKGGAGGVKDLAGNPMASDFVISWTTRATSDTTAPFVIGTVNANGAINVPVNTNTGATFSEGMDPLTVTSLQFALKQTVSGAAVAGVVSYSGVNVVFVPLSGLSPNTGYTATVKGGAGGVTDLAGNPMATDYVWSWTTGAAPDTTAPTIRSTAPLANATSVPTNTVVTARFSEAMDPLTITNATMQVACGGGTPSTGTVSYNLITGVASFTSPANTLPTGSSCTATVTTGAKDVAGNALASGLVPNPWTFSTAAAVVPPPAGVDLGSAAQFAVLSGTILTNTVAGTTLVTGVVGAYTQNVPPPNPGYANYTTDPTIANAVNDMKTAVDNVNLRTCDTPYAGNTTLNNVTIIPGVYCVAGSLIVSGNLTLNGPGLYIIRVATTLDTPTNTVVGYAGGATDANTTVFWVPVGATTLGAPTTFKGTIMSKAGAITLNDGANMSALNGVSGRILSGVAVNMLANNIIDIAIP